MQPQILAKARNIKLLVLDVDGIMTDGRLLYGANGEVVKTFHALDGHGIRMLMQCGIQIGIISARESLMVTKRASDLGIKYVQQGIHDKHAALTSLLKQLNLHEKDCCYMGDDVIDLPVLTKVGFAVSVPNGHPEVILRADFITNANGGNGAVREICDLILRAQNHYDTIMESYLK